MGVTHGFKQTTVGAIPGDWEVVPLVQLIHSVEYGSSAKSRAEGRVPVLRMGNLKGGKIDWTDLVYTDDEDEVNKYRLSTGDVLFNRTNTIDLVGKTSIYEDEQPAIFAGYLIRINVIQEILDSRFLNYVLNAEFSRKFSVQVLSVAVGQANINGQKLKSYPIPLPPKKEEQLAIADALSDADALIESLEQLLAKKRQIKQGAMQELLTGNRRLPGFSKKWELRRLDALASILSGGTPSTTQPEYWGGDVPWCTPTDITALDGCKYLSETSRTITCEGLKASSAEVIPVRSVVMTSRATIGECAINAVPVTTNQGFKSFVPFADVEVEFLYYLLLIQTQAFISLCGGSTFLEIGKTQLAAFEVGWPATKEEQTAIAAILSDMDAELDALKVKLTKARQIKQGMMQELLTGRIRLV
jgi:type I restriction enzyme S subunit